MGLFNIIHNIALFFGALYNTYMKNLNIQNIVWKEGKYFVSQCLNVDVSSFGKTKNEALKNLQQALSLYFEYISVSMVQKVQNPEVVPFSFKYA